MNNIPENSCSSCERKNCPNYVRRTPLSNFGYFMLHFMLGIVCLTTVFICFMAIRWSVVYFNLDNVPGAPAVNEFVSPTDSSAELTVGLGVTVVEVGDMAESAGIDGGLVIMYIDPTSAFAGTDVEVNDGIVAVEGKPIVVFDDLRRVLITCQPGDELTLTIARFEDGSPVEREVTIELVPLAAQ